MTSINLTRSQHWEIITVPTLSEEEIEQQLTVLREQYDILTNHDTPYLIDVASAIQSLEIEKIIRALEIRSFTNEELEFICWQQSTDGAAKKAINYELDVRWILRKE